MLKRYFQIEHPALLRLSGNDVLRFLNGQLTQDIRSLQSNQNALLACLLDPKGKLQMRLSVCANASGDFFLYTASHPLENLVARLDRYIIADDVEMHIDQEPWEWYHFLDEKPSLNEDAIIRECHRYGIRGYDVLTPSTITWNNPLLGWQRIEEEDMESTRIQHRIPRWGYELEEGMLIPEAGLDITDVSYQKGCYIGQEVISRMKSSGKVNKKLHLFSFPHHTLFHSKDTIWHHEYEAGYLTSVDAESGLALGYLNKKYFDSSIFHAHDQTGKPVELNKIQ
jgi:tRNA-modifying protein YgfZ